VEHREEDNPPADSKLLSAAYLVAKVYRQGSAVGDPDWGKLRATRASGKRTAFLSAA